MNKGSTTFRLTVFALLVSLLLIGGVSSAQNPVPIITLAVPEFSADAFTDTMLAEFETAFNVDVVVVKPGQAAGVPPIEFVGAETYVNAARTYAEVADVLFVDGYTITPESTRAGVLLDLMPLVQTDTTFTPDVFYRAAWESYRWDNGLWALPMGMTHTVVIYDPAAFDAAGLTYPTTAWTIQEFANAARALTVRDASGQVTVPGLFSFETALLFRTLIGESAYDIATTPNAPRLDTAELASLLQTWHDLETEGVIGSSDGIFLGEGYQSPLVIGQALNLTFPDRDGRTLMGALLPGNTAGVRVNGFAVSGGTTQPQLAYELAKFLTARQEVSARFFTEVFARRGLEVPEAQNMPLQHASSETQALVMQAAENALPVAEMRFMNYALTALRKMRDEGVDAATALQQTEAEVLGYLQVADAARATPPVVQAAPTQPVLAEGKIALKFGLNVLNPVLHNQAQWDQTVADFVASDPLVGHVQIDTSSGQNTDLTQTHDCFYLPYVVIPTQQPAHFLNLDPFISADANFDAADALPGVMQQVTRDNQIWALPMLIIPEALAYNEELFAQHGLALPVEGWTAEQFLESVKTLHTATGGEAFTLSVFGGSQTLLITAAFGGLPVDYRTIPPTFNFTAPESVEAIRQMLDLTRSGEIAYQWKETPIYGFRIEPLSPFFEYSADIPFRVVPHPRGSQYVPLSYSLGAGYISASSAAPDACYRWLTHLARHPELFSAMPAYRSLLDSQAVATQLGEEGVAFYKAYAALLSDPNAVVFPSASSSGLLWQGVYFVDKWMTRAFDNVVLHGADLQTELETLQGYLTEFTACTANAAAAEWQPYYDCAVRIDPSVATN